MTARALIPQAELERALRAAAKLGLRVVTEGGQIHFLPIDPNAALPSPDLTDSDFAARLAQWRRSA